MQEKAVAEETASESVHSGLKRTAKMAKPSAIAIKLHTAAKSNSKEEPHDTKMVKASVAHSEATAAATATAKAPAKSVTATEATREVRHGRRCECVGVSVGCGW